MFNYKGRVVVMTGASSGLGKQMARGFAECGANLVLMARRVERLEEFAKEWLGNGYVLSGKRPCGDSRHAGSERRI